MDQSRMVPCKPRYLSDLLPNLSKSPYADEDLRCYTTAKIRSNRLAGGEWGTAGLR